MARLDAIGIVVSSMASATEFYRHLGLEFPPGSEDEGHVETEAPGGIRVMLDTEDMMKSFSEWEAPKGGGQRTSLAFLCETPAEVNRLHLLLTGIGGSSVVAPFDAPWSMRYATVADPDGNHFDLFAHQEQPSA
ncbi:MAG TPA: VOC family protein [Acidimicrobiia bacterium]|jgi:predicted lactoylglutathione lyase|nr:VOC family protein [Acidimicrobiia bacterium]